MMILFYYIRIKKGRVKRTYVSRTDLWRLHVDRGRGSPSKEYWKRVRARDVLVDSYVVSYDVVSNPTVTEGEVMQTVKNNRLSLVDQWCLLNRCVTTPLPPES